MQPLDKALPGDLGVGFRLEEYREGDSAKDSLLLTQKLLLCPLGDGCHLKEALLGWISESFLCFPTVHTWLGMDTRNAPQLTPKFLGVSEPWRQSLSLGDRAYTNICSPNLAMSSCTPKRLNPKPLRLIWSLLGFSMSALLC